MKEVKIILGLLLILTLPSNGQALRNFKESARNNKQIAVGKAQIARDQRELDDFHKKRTLFEEAINREDVELADRLRLELIEAMKVEVSQGNEKLAQDNREVSQSKAELHSENREIRKDRGEIREKGSQLGEVRDLAGDKYDRRDDKGDLRDDRRDRLDQAAVLKKEKEVLIAAEPVTVRGGSRDQLDQLIQLFGQFELYMQQDLEYTNEELAEDREEKVEDRFERHDDRQERRDDR